MKPFLSILRLITLGASLLTGICSAETSWKFTFDAPPAGWEKPDFTDATWKSGPAGFGSTGKKTPPGAIVRTEWTTPDIWLRRSFSFEKIPARPALMIHHDEDAKVFLNGSLLATLEGFTQSYRIIPLDEPQKSLLKMTDNLLAIHCRQTTGGQSIDAHIVDAQSLPDLRDLLGTDGAVRSKLMTEWGSKVTPENAWTEYPRPQLERKEWTHLNGHWDYQITLLDAARPVDWLGKILVPFPIESRLSGVQRMLQPHEALWYQRRIDAGPVAGKRTLLHFEAVDYQCTVWINDRQVGTHKGGNLPFSFDITEYLLDKENTLTVRVLDATGGFQLRGKQTQTPGGIFYTRNSGIWQTVWLENVSARHISSLGIRTDVETGSITLQPVYAGAPVAGETLEVIALDGGKPVATTRGELTLRIPNAKLWSPASPHLYPLQVVLRDGKGNTIDEVSSYAGIRKVGRTADAAGHQRFTLNDQPLFHWGVLDQGWWPDGLLAPPSDEAMLFEIQWLKDAGFNMIRKHVKVEPRRYYYHCDRIGMMVWQDQVSGGASPPWTRMAKKNTDAIWSDEDHAQWMSELDTMISTLDPFPCIAVWTPFNEAWGQHRTMEVGEWTVKRDPSRIVNIASGGNFHPVGHIANEHSYPNPSFPLDDQRFGNYLKVVGEFGGHGWPVKGHLWDDSKGNWGYGGLPKSLDEYRQRYEKSIAILADLKRRGVAAGVYTQTTDVEEEINGLMTYDRRVMKIPAAELRKIHASLMAD